jgi:predicted secreted protein
LVTVTHEFGRKENGKRHALRIGDHFAVVLPETASAGYQWTPVSIPTVVKLTEHGSHVDLERPGASASHRFSFRVEAAETGTLVLGLTRAWEHEQAPVETYELEIVGSESKHS